MNNNIKSDQATIHPSNEFLTLLDNSLYIFPQHYKKIKKTIRTIERSLLDRNAVTVNDSNFRKYSDKFVILSHRSDTSTEGQLRHVVTREVGLAISVFYEEWKKTEREKNELLKEKEKDLNDKFFYDNILPGFRFGEIKIKLIDGTVRNDICKLVFKNPKNIQKIWQLDVLIKKIGEDYMQKDWYRTVYDMTRELNERIEEQTKLKDYFLFKNRTLSINPEYIK